MKRIKILSLVAVVLASGAAFATQSSAKFVGQKYRLNGTTWVNINSQVLGTHYRCDDAAPEQICTAQFTSNPNTDPSSQNSEEFGVYTPLP